MLYHGEELDGLRLIDLLLDLDEGTAAPGTVYRPLISVVVPVYDRTREIDHLHGLYELLRARGNLF